MIFTVMTVRTASTTSHLLAAFRFGLPVAYADDASVGITERIREGARAGSEKGSEIDQRRGQNRIKEGVRTGSEEASEQDQKAS